MARLIRIEPELEKTVTHKECGAFIGYYHREIETDTYQDYGGGLDSWDYIICPNCGKKVEVFNR